MHIYENLLYNFSCINECFVFRNIKKFLYQNIEQKIIFSVAIGKTLIYIKNVIFITKSYEKEVNEK